jgi:glyceraldehyde 3-phosphate dehydrogenase
MNGIAIHGFGRIGSPLLRVALQDRGFTPVAVSDIKDASTLAALFAVDTNLGRWPETVAARGNALAVGEREIAYVDTTQGLPDWRGLGVAVVVDCTGRATTRAGAQADLDCGAERVLVSAPSKSADDCDAAQLAHICDSQDWCPCVRGRGVSPVTQHCAPRNRGR